MAENNNIERRVIGFEDMELRVEEGDNPKLIGYGAVFDRWSVDLGGFREKITPGAFAEALKTSDVRGLKNHDANLILGRTPKTMRLKETSVGLRYEIDVPNTTTGRDTLEEVRRGDISGSSFAFTVPKGGDEWQYPDNAIAERTINAVNYLYDVSVVTTPAYPDTTVASRSLDEFRKTSEIPKQENTEEPETREKEQPEETPELTKLEQIQKQRDIERKYDKAGRIIDRLTKKDS